MTTDLPVRNSALLEKIAAAIEENPARHDQSRWSSVVEDVFRPASRSVRLQMGRELDDSPASFADLYTTDETWCGTAYCVAGWSQALQGRRVIEDNVLIDGREPRPVADQAVDDLGLAEHEAKVLFAATASPADDGLTFADALRAFAAGADIDACFTR